jgi:hypothetical protein
VPGNSASTGLLFRVPSLEGPYRRYGWHKISATSITRLDEIGRDAPLPFKSIAMLYLLARRELPVGPIPLRGNDRQTN